MTRRTFPSRAIPTTLGSVLEAPRSPPPPYKSDHWTSPPPLFLLPLTSRRCWLLQIPPPPRPPMETAAVLRSFHGTTAIAQMFLEKPAVLPAHNASLRNLPLPQVAVTGGRMIFSTRLQHRPLLPSLKVSEAPTAAISDDASEKTSGSLEKKNIGNSIFPNGFEALVLEVCDGTDVAELKLKVGDFEMNLRRNVGAPKSPPHIVSPTTAPPIPSEPMVESAPAASSVVLQKPTQVSTNPFSIVSSAKMTKLAALEASGTNAFVLVSSPKVGSFRSGRTIKGKKQPPSCKEGDLIKEGQTIGYLDQFGNELPVTSDVAGEVLKVFFKDGDAVGYGDPLVAILPSFPGINQ